MADAMLNAVVFRTLTEFRIEPVILIGLTKVKTPIGGMIGIRIVRFGSTK